MILKAWEQDDVSNSNTGRPPKLNRAEQLLIALQYWREKRNSPIMAITIFRKKT